MPKTFVIESSDETWVRETVSSIREELRRMPPDGPRFEKTVLSIITRESHYVRYVLITINHELTNRRHGRMKDVPKVYLRSHPWIIRLQRNGQNSGKGDYHHHADLGSQWVQWLYRICGEGGIVISINYGIGSGTSEVTFWDLVLI